MINFTKLFMILGVLLSSLSIQALSLPPPEIETHTISVTIAGNNDFILYIDGKVFNQKESNKIYMKTFKANVTGPGPWAVAIQTKAVGIVSGLMGAVYVDGILVSNTGFKNKKVLPFKMSNTKTRGWKDVSYDDSWWSTSRVNPIGCNFNLWDDWIDKFQNLSETRATPVWTDYFDDTIRTNYFRLVVSLPETHRISVFLAVDDDFVFDIDGKKVSQTESDWCDIKTFETTVTGKGPWVLAIKAQDYGVVAGLMAAVYVDGVLMSATGPDTEGLLPFKISKKKTIGWKTASYDDSLWTSSRVEPLGCDFFYWADWITRFQKISNTKATPVWKDSCDDIRTTNYFRLVLGQSSNYL